MAQCPNCGSKTQTPGTSCTNCGRPVPMSISPPSTTPAPVSSRSKSFSGFVRKYGKVIRGKRETKTGKRLKETAGKFKEDVQKVGTKVKWWSFRRIVTLKNLGAILLGILFLIILLYGVYLLSGSFVITGILISVIGFVVVLFGFTLRSRENRLGWLPLLVGFIIIIFGLYVLNFFSKLFLGSLILGIIILAILFSKKLSPKIKFLVILISTILISIFFFFPNIISFLLSFALLKWIIFLVLFLLGFWLIFKKDQQGKYPYRFIGLLLIIVSILSLFLSTVLSVIGFDFTTIFSSFRWLIIGFLGVMLLVSLLKGKFTWAILFFFLILAVWFLGSESGSLFLSNLGVKAEVAGGESFSARLSKYWNYVKNPEDFFARYGEFTNPNIEKKALVGIKIEKFEPLIKEFRTNQDLRFMGEIKNYALPLPLFKDEKGETFNIGVSCSIPREMQEIQANLESHYADEVVIKPGSSRPYQPPITFDFSPESDRAKEELKMDFRYKLNEQLIEESKFKNFTKFVTCNFNAGKVGAIKEKETRRAYINVSYRDFITRSDIYVYLLGNDAYQKIEDGVLQAGGDLDTEFLYQLRNAASYPGLIDNERRTISEFSSGPVWLQVNILDQQPLKPGGDDQYTLIVRSKPNSVDWTGAIDVKNIYLEVPNWFSAVDSRCDFSGGDSSNVRTNSKRLILREKIGGIDKKVLLSECAGSGSSCAFTCDFKVNSGKNEQNIQEYRISAYQITDYSMSQGTTFDYIRASTTGVIDENEEAKNNPSGFMDRLASGNIDDLKRYVEICKNKEDILKRLSTETINKLKDHCTELSVVEEKLSGQTETLGSSLNEVSEGDIKLEIIGQKLGSANIGRFGSRKEVYSDSIAISIQTNKPAECGFKEYENRVNVVTFENKISFVSNDGEIHNYTLTGIQSGDHDFGIICKARDKPEEVSFTEIHISKK